MKYFLISIDEFLSDEQNLSKMPNNISNSSKILQFCDQICEISNPFSKKFSKKKQKIKRNIFYN